jgi:hypothetical protein
MRVIEKACLIFPSCTEILTGASGMETKNAYSNQKEYAYVTLGTTALSLPEKVADLLTLQLYYAPLSRQNQLLESIFALPNLRLLVPARTATEARCF